MTTPLPESLAELLRAALEAWRIEGLVARDQDGALLIFRAKRSAVDRGEGQQEGIRVARAPAGLPFRFAVTIGGRERMATGVAGVLRLVRSAVDPDYEAQRLRVGGLPTVTQ